MLTGKEKRALRAQGSLLKPVVHIGKEGFAEKQIDFIYTAFNTRELVKIKVLENAPMNKIEISELFQKKLPDTEIVQIIGNNILLYRPFPEEDK